MSFGLALTGLGIAQAGLAIARPEWAAGWRGLLAWSALSFAAAGLAYGRVGPSLFGKRADGTLSAFRVALLLPYFAATWLLYAVAQRPPKWHRVADGLVLGRRLNRASSLPEGTTLVVDLTAELPEPSAVRGAARYLCVPAPDGHVPEPSAFAAAVREAAAERGVVYVHCAQGHGRGALFAAAVLLARGGAATAQAAVRALRTVRPGVRLTGAQRAFLERFATGLTGDRSCSTSS